ncbi:transposase [Microtetraspora sp. NBRC 16547]|uniref:transposase n=1 Tax=Microtetraspora sp. NBRC 16547 TaxID=3030993 RepID=UPI0024A40B7B|nr:transposase [Microtetraspora sp. NBRC 16547]GLW99350.1 hypothetical protein Misp02_34370 [Microtetraspora sp. NBRC 16547]
MRQELLNATQRSERLIKALLVLARASTAWIDRLPSTSMQVNTAWCVAAAIATDLLCWLRLLCLSGTMSHAEPKTLRYRLLHTAVRLVRGQRKRKIKIPQAWPWAHELADCFTFALALAPPG